MWTPPSDVDTAHLVAALREHWNLAVVRLEYRPVGGGAHHWVAADTTGRRWFVTCDDLDTKPWLGTSSDTVYDGLVGCYQAALDLSEVAGLGFVVAPVPGLHAVVATRLGTRYSRAVFALVEGTPGRWGEPVDVDGRAQLFELLAQLHAAEWAAPGAALRAVAIPGRERLEEALGDLTRPWTGGPYSEEVRRALEGSASVVDAWLRQFDRLAARLTTSGGDVVVTHGEPHPGNLIREQGSARLRLVDWDTIARARPERDLWMLDDGTPNWSNPYTQITGRAVDPVAVRAYRMAWTLTDLALFVSSLRAPHTADADSARKLKGIGQILAGEEPAPYGRPLPPTGRRPSKH